MTIGRPSPGQLAQIACLLEVSARKPGNVHRFRDFDDTGYLDFLLSASAIAIPLDLARLLGVGRAVLLAVEATRQVVATNTNLGMILLLAPLCSVPDGEPLASGVLSVLQTTTVDDARHAYQAIRLAQPGGLGTSPSQDVAEEPTITLTDAMKLAVGRDLVARQYANGFADVFGTARPSLDQSLSEGRSLETAIVASYLALLGSLPDTLIARKRGDAEAIEASRRARDVIAAGWPDSADAQSRLDAFDAWLRLDGHARNPGASADLIAATLFTALRDGIIPLPRPANPKLWSHPL